MWHVDGVDYYNDSKGTNTEASIRSACHKKPIVLIGGGYDKGLTLTNWLELFQARKASGIV